MAPSFNSQFPSEESKNTKYVFLTMAVTMLLPAIHGALFSWMPWYLRSKRDAASLKYKPYFAFVKYFDTFTKVLRVRIFGKTHFYQPSLLVVMAIHLGLTGYFLIAEISNPDYLSKLVTVSMRVGRVSIGSVIMILIFVSKNTYVSAFSGLTLDKAVFFHKWLGRFMFITATIHMALAIKYYRDVNEYSMITESAQIFGFIAWACLGIDFMYVKYFRIFAFDLFLMQHRVVNFVMLLTALIHNGGNVPAVLIGAFFFALDFVVSLGLGYLHKKKSPTKGISEFEILDDTTIRVSIPLTIRNFDKDKWSWSFVPRYGNWRAGQHIYLNVFKVSWLLIHPFTISSLSDSGKIVLVIKVHKGFTRKLKLMLQKLAHDKDEEAGIELSSELLSRALSTQPYEVPISPFGNEDILRNKDNESEVYASSVQEFRDIIDSFELPEILRLSSGFAGPYGGTHQPLTRFDSVVLISAGSGASFTLPVALDLLKTIKAREEADDYLFRPTNTAVHVVMAMRKIANLQWYDHLWEEFLPFLKSGRAQLSVDITQEVPDAAWVEGEDSEEKDEEEDISRTTQFLASSSRKHDPLISTSATSVLTGFSITYSRPEFSSIIGDAVRLVSSKEYRKSFACLGCGPNNFNGEIKRFCDKNRWVKGGPDIYCYTESFG